MDELIVVLDGITVQHAGELLLDSVTTSTQRADCRDTYIQSLEDFAFSIAFGSKFGVYGSLPKVGPDSPGQSLSDLFINQRMDMNTKNDLKPEQLIHIDSYRKSILLDLVSLDRAYRVARNYYEHWAVRDFVGSFGDSETLKLKLDDPGGYEYGKRPPLIIDRELQDLIPSMVIDGLAETIRAKGLQKDCDSFAVKEFISRLILTHITINWWYEEAINKTSPNATRLPHITRSLLIQGRMFEESHAKVENIQRIVSQHALAYAMRNTSNRYQVMQELHLLPTLSTFKQTRSLLIDLFQLLSEEEDEKKKQREISAIYEAITGLVSTTNAAHDNLAVQVGDPQSAIKIGGINPILVANSIIQFANKPKRILRKFFSLKTFASHDDYMRKLIQTFPELRLNESPD